MPEKRPFHDSNKRKPFHDSNKRRNEALALAQGEPYDVIEFRGARFDKQTASLLWEAERRLGYELTVMQGSYNTGVSQSGGTHDGGGAADLAPFDHKRKVRVLRKLGMDAWHRPELWVDGRLVWGEHIHGVVHNNKRLSAAAKAQTVDYDNHLNGLASHARDHQKPHPDRPPVWNYHKWAREQRQAERARRRWAGAARKAVNALRNLLRHTDDKATRAEIQSYIKGVRAH